MALPIVSTASSNGARTQLPGIGTAYAIDGGGISGFSEIVPASITANLMAVSSLQLAQVNLTAAQIITLFTAPIILIPAPGAGKSIYVQDCLFRFVYGGVAYTGGGVSSISYAGGATPLTTVPAATITAGASSDSLLTTAAVTITQNAALQISTATANFAAGNGTLQIYIYYTVL